MTTIENNYEAIVKEIEAMSNEEQMEIHNQYCENINNMDNQIFYNDEEFFEMFFSGRITDLVRAISYGDFEPNQEFIKFDGYANLETFDNVSLYLDAVAIADDIQENPKNYSHLIELTSVEDDYWWA